MLTEHVFTPQNTGCEQLEILQDDPIWTQCFVHAVAHVTGARGAAARPPTAPKPPHHPPSQPRCAAAPHTALRGLTKRPRALTHRVRCPTYPCGSCAQRKEPCSSEPFLRACVPRTHAVRTHSAAPQLHSGQQCHRDAGRGCITRLQRISAVKAHAAAKRTDGASHAPGLVARCIADLRAPRPHPSDGGTVAGICGSAREASCGQHGSRLACQQARCKA